MRPLEGPHGLGFGEDGIDPAGELLEVAVGPRGLCSPEDACCQLAGLLVAPDIVFLVRLAITGLMGALHGASLRRVVVAVVAVFVSTVVVIPAAAPAATSLLLMLLIPPKLVAVLRVVAMHVV